MHQTIFHMYTFSKGPTHSFINETPGHISVTPLTSVTTLIWRAVMRWWGYVCHAAWWNQFSPFNLFNNCELTLVKKKTQPNPNTSLPTSHPCHTSGDGCVVREDQSFADLSRHPAFIASNSLITWPVTINTAAPCGQEILCSAVVSNLMLFTTILIEMNIYAWDCMSLIPSFPF